MKVIVNGVEIDIIGGSRLVYDVEGDSLSVDPIDSPKKTSPLPKKKADDNTEKPAKKKSNQKLSQEELRNSAIECISLSKDWTAKQFVTTHCLGIGSSSRDKNYLSLLLDKMSDEGVIVCSKDTGRARFKIA